MTRGPRPACCSGKVRVPQQPAPWETPRSDAGWRECPKGRTRPPNPHRARRKPSRGRSPVQSIPGSASILPACIWQNGSDRADTDCRRPGPESRPSQAGSLVRRQGAQERRGNPFSNILLDAKHIVDLTVIFVGPELLPGACIDQAGCDQHSITQPTDASLEKRGYAERLADRVRGVGASFISHGRRVCDHLQAPHSSELARDVFGNPVTEVIVVRIAGSDS